MPQETELKLKLRAQDMHRLLTHPLLASSAPKRQRLLNTYFDTASLSLMRQRVAVRERRIGRRTLLTVKTAGQSVGGLSQRGEWEAPTRPGHWDFASLVDDVALAHSLDQLAGQLVPLFRTDFVRRSWLLDFDDARIEVALDQGHISTGHRGPQGQRVEPILELELELQQGSPQALLALAQRLALGPQGDAATALWLYPFHRSKAERGLALYLGQHPRAVPAGAPTLSPDVLPLEAFRSEALHTLAHLQAHACLYLEQRDTGQPTDPEVIDQMRSALRRLQTGLRLFASMLPRLLVLHWCARWQASASALDEAHHWDRLATRLRPRQTNGSMAARALLDWAQARRDEAHARVEHHLSAPAHALDMLACTRMLLALRIPTHPSADLPDWALEQLRKHRTRLEKQAIRSLKGGERERAALHADAMALSDALDMLANLLPAERVQACVAWLAEALQTLDEWHDLRIARALLAPSPLPGAGPIQQQLAADQIPLLRRLRHTERALSRTRAP